MRLNYANFAKNFLAMSFQQEPFQSLIIAVAYDTTLRRLLSSVLLVFDRMNYEYIIIRRRRQN